MYFSDFMCRKVTFLGQLQDVFRGAFIREQANHSAAEEAWRREKATLQANLNRATDAAKQAATRIQTLSLIDYYND